MCIQDKHFGGSRKKLPACVSGKEREREREREQRSAKIFYYPHPPLVIQWSECVIRCLCREEIADSSLVFSIFRGRDDNCSRCAEIIDFRVFQPWRGCILLPERSCILCLGCEGDSKS